MNKDTLEFTRMIPENPRKLRCKWVAGEEVSLKHWRNALAVIRLYFGIGDNKNEM